MRPKTIYIVILSFSGKAAWRWQGEPCLLAFGRGAGVCIAPFSYFLLSSFFFFLSSFFLSSFFFLSFFFLLSSLLQC